jgi:hypothetical protein
VIYLSPRGHPSLTPDKFGILIRSVMGSRFADKNLGEIVRGFKWAMDNSAFSGNFNAENYIEKMGAMTSRVSTCLFVTAPDVVGNAKDTISLYPEWREKIRSFGFPAAFVGQDGLENYGLPDDFDALFIGGSTKWKLSKAARELAQESKRRGKWLHMGRVNSLARIHYAESIGCDSVDGTHIIFEPRRASRRLVAWMNQKSLFLGGY